MKFTIKLIWDDETLTWFTDSDDINVLLNDESYDNLIKRTKDAVYDLMADDKRYAGYTGPIHLVYESARHEEDMVS